jgi:hypothetical protein
MTCHRSLSGPAKHRLKAIPPPNADRASRSNLLLFPTGQHKGAVMLGHGDDAGHCPNGLSAKNYRAATPEDRVTYRKWMLGIVVFYCTLLLISGIVAIVVDFGAGSTKLTSLSARPTAGSPRSN